MHEERDALQRRVFPELRRLCESRGVTWSDIDLRWGITEEDRKHDRVLPLCLAEIDECRPFFIGILGERYGWIPRFSDASVLESYPWLESAAGRSYTELEIIHGALNDPDARAFFYLRDPAYLERPSLTQEQRESYRSKDPGERRLLRELKERIRASSHPVRDFADWRELERLVAGDLEAMIEREFPTQAELPHERYEASQRAFVANLAGTHVGSDAELDAIDRFALATSGPQSMTVAGESGCGKSSLLAQWLFERAGRLGDKQGDRRESGGWLARWFRPVDRRASDPCVLSRFVEASEDGRTVEATVVALVESACRLGGFRQEIPPDPVGAAMALLNSLGRLSATRRTIVLLDGLDHLDPRRQGLDLSWLPETLPPNVRLIVSARPGPVLDALGRRGSQPLIVSSLEQDARREFVRQYLRIRHGKGLDDRWLERLSNLAGGANPAFLTVLLEELRLTVRRTPDLETRIATYAEAGAVDELFEKVIDRLTREFAEEPAGLVENALGFLAVARHGLSDSDLRDLLRSPDDPLPAAYWTPLLAAIRPFLIIRSGLWAPAMPAFRDAIARRFLSKPGARDAFRRRLAEYFGSRPIASRAVEERPYALAAIGAWKDLAALLCDPDFLIAAWPLHRFELLSYWRLVEGELGLTPLVGYRPLLDQPDERPDAALVAARALASLGYTSEPAKLASFLVARAERSGPVEDLVEALDFAATLADRLRDDAAASTITKRLIQVAEASSIPADRLAGLMRYATAERRLGRSDSAARALAQAERLAVEQGATDRLPDLLGLRAALSAESDPKGALRLLRRQEAMLRRLGDSQGLRVCLGNQGVLLADLDRSREALTVLAEEETVARRIRDLAGLEACLGRQADVLIRRRRLDEALVKLRAREALCRDSIREESSLARVHLQYAELFGVVMKQLRLGLHHVEKAGEHARADTQLASAVETQRRRVTAASLRDGG